MKWLRPGRLWPRTMAGQLVALLLLALVAAQFTTFVILRDERHSAVEAVDREQGLERAAALVRLLDETDEAVERKRALRAFSTRRLRFWLADEAAVEGRPTEPAPALADRLGELLGDDRPISYAIALGEIERRRHGRTPWHEQFEREGYELPERAVPGLILSIELEPGQWLNGAMLLPPKRPDLGSAPLVALLLTAVAISIAAALGLRRLARPLQALAHAADAVGRGERVALATDTGPAEIRRTAEAFNRMQDRIGRAMAERSRLLAAISHDLRTPITSLRLRAELVEDAELRERMLATLDEMQALTEAGLLLARGTATEEPTTPADLGAMVESIAADFTDLGADVELAEAPRLVVPCRPLALKRALRNLIENAVRYGGGARVALARADHAVTVTIDDDGPGLPEEQLERVFDPFVRGEASRSPETGGAGLGLAIARTILRAHGGDVVLTNREGADGSHAGLRATVTLPAVPGDA